MEQEQPNFARPVDMRHFDKGSGTGVIAYGLDDGLLVTFFIKPKHMEWLSNELGHPIFQDRVMTRIIAPGNNKTVWEHEAKGIVYDTAVDPDTGEYHTQWDKLEVCENGDPTEPDKYPKAWAVFMKKGQPSDLGTPIEEWGAISRSMAESLKLLNVPTIEALAALTDAAAANIMGGRKWRDLAKAELNDNQKRKILAHEQQARERAEDKVVGLESKVAELTALITTMQQQFAESMQPGAQAPAFAQAKPRPLVKSARAPQSRRHRAPAEGDAAA